MLNIRYLIFVTLLLTIPVLLGAQAPGFNQDIQVQGNNVGQRADLRVGPDGNLTTGAGATFQVQSGVEDNSTSTATTPLEAETFDDYLSESEFSPREKIDLIKLKGKTLELIVGSDDLSAYTQMIKSSLSEVSDVVIEKRSVQVFYKHSAQLFGFIPSHLVSKISIDNIGRLEIESPWYGIFYTKSLTETEKEIVDQLEQLKNNKLFKPSLIGNQNSIEAVRSNTLAINLIVNSIIGEGNKYLGI